MVCHTFSSPVISTPEESLQELNDRNMDTPENKVTIRLLRLFIFWFFGLLK